MKAYVWITFAVLAVTFFQLSGGTEYAPRPGSLQAAAQAQPDAAIRTTELPHITQRTPVPRTEPTVTRAAFDISLTAAATVQTPTAAPPVAEAARPTPVTEPAAPRPDPLESYSLARLTPVTAQEPVPADTATAEAAKDIRSVLKSRVNLRMGPGTQYDVAAKLDEGAQVQLLETSGDGWVKLRVLDSGRIGWMADTLISAAN